jgi:hypothetical protein
MRVDGAIYADIADRFGVSLHTVGHRARRESWPSPTRAPPRRAKSSPGSPATAGIRSRLAQRLYKVIEFRIRMMELRMYKQLQAHEQDPDGSVPPAPGKDERESFAALIESINKVTEMASEPAPAAGGRRQSAVPVDPGLAALSDDVDPDGLAIASEKDALCRDIAERLAKIFPPA